MEASIRVDEVRFEAMMKEKGHNFSSLAKEVKCTSGAIVRLKVEGTCSFRFLTRVCVALDIHPFDLIVVQGLPPVRLPRPGEPLIVQTVYS